MPHWKDNILYSANKRTIKNIYDTARAVENNISKVQQTSKKDRETIAREISLNGIKGSLTLFCIIIVLSLLNMQVYHNCSSITRH